MYVVKWLITRIMGVQFLVEAGFCWCPAQKIIQNRKRVEAASSSQSGADRESDHLPASSIPAKTT